MKTVFIFIAFAFLAATLGCKDEAGSSSDILSKQTVYIHVFSNRYDQIFARPPIDNAEKKQQCLLSVAIHSGSDVFIHCPNHYEPDLEISGRLLHREGRLYADLIISIGDPMTAFDSKVERPVDLNKFYPFGVELGYGGEFWVVFTDSETPPEGSAIPEYHEG
jgi:hypothetical protein